MKRKAVAAEFVLGMLVLSIFLYGCSGPPPGGGAVQSQVELTKKTSEVIPAANPAKNPDTAKKRTDTLVIGMPNSDGVFSDVFTTSVYDWWLSASIFESMLKTDTSGKFTPHIAEKWEISPDGKEYTFHLRKDARFADGHPLTAGDVAFIYYVMADKSYDGQYDPFRFYIKGLKEYREGTASSIAGIQIIDPYTIQFSLEQPSARALDFIGGMNIYPKHYYGKDYRQGDCSGVKALNRKPMGSGPYKLSAFTEGVEVLYVANENYWGKKPGIPRVIYKVTNPNTVIQMLATGEIDIARGVGTNARNINQLKDMGFVDIHMYPTSGYSYIGLNNASPLFQDKRVRQALTYGLNRKQIVETFTEGYGKVSTQPQSMVSDFYNPDVNLYEYNPEKAAALLAESGWKKGGDGILAKDGVKFEIRFTATAPSPLNEILIPIVKQNLEALGIAFIPEQMEFNAVKQKVDARKADSWGMAWSLANDPDNNIYMTKGAQNNTGYSNPKVDELYLKGRSLSNRDERIKVYQEIYKLINEDAPVIFLLQNATTIAVNSRVKGLETSPFRDFMWYLGTLQLQ